MVGAMMMMMMMIHGCCCCYLTQDSHEASVAVSSIVDTTHRVHAEMEMQVTLFVVCFAMIASCVHLSSQHHHEHRHQTMLLLLVSFVIHYREIRTA